VPIPIPYWKISDFGAVAHATHPPTKQLDDKKMLARTRTPRARLVGKQWGWGVAVQSNGAYGSAADEKTSASRMRCDHCRKSFGMILHRYFRMRFCSADCLSAYQDRLNELTMVKIRCLELPSVLPGN
jgi:hypothetical protein